MKDKIDIDAIIDPRHNISRPCNWSARRKAVNFAIINKWLKLRKAKFPSASASAEGKPSAEICATKTAKMNLNCRIRMRFEEMNIHTLGDIIRFQSMELKTYNFGYASIAYLQGILNGYGAKLPTVSDSSADIFRVTPEYLEAGLYRGWVKHLFIITPKAMTIYEEERILEAIQFEHRKIITK